MLDAALLQQATLARDHVERLTDSLDEARIRFTQTLRQLHTGGASLREIAGAFGLSYQRVHQLVGDDVAVQVLRSLGGADPAVARTGLLRLLEGGG